MDEVLNKIYNKTLEDIMGDRFARYSKCIIQDRALPDARDGLKPVQRRILYGMYVGNHTYDKPHVKSARSVGDIMGKYHPHGDSSIYDAMVRMSQWWKQNLTYIDMKGNNGSMDGDPAAAMRYTEARLSKISNELMKDIKKDTVNMVWNFDDTLKEPTVLPAKYPNLLVNGSTGISAGYATNIPPHNLGEIIDATIKRIDNPNCRLETIMDIVKGPDFPTGAIVEGIKGIQEAFRTGRGKVMIKSKFEFVKTKNKEQVVITEIPFEVNKQNLVRKIDEIRIEKKVDGIAEVRDESDGEDPVRIVIDLKKDCNKELVINYLLKNTEMMISYNYNMVAIVNRRPMTLGILELLDAYISHQKECVTRRTRFDLEHAKERMHIVDGLIKAISILDEVIRVIRSSKNKADSINNLVKEFGFSEKQADAIVTLQLYRLSNTDVTELQEEHARLELIIKGLEEILSSEDKLKSLMKDELRKIKKEYSVPRKSEIKEEVTEIKIDTTTLIPKEDVMVVVTKEGYVKRVSIRSFEASADDTLVKDGDYVIGKYKMTTMDTLLLFTDHGNYLYIPVYELPDLKWKELGKHVSNIIAIKSEENIIAGYPVYDFDSDNYITIFTKNGMVKRTILSEFKAMRYSKPITAMKLKDDDRVVSVISDDEENVLITTNDGYCLCYNIDEIPITGLKTMGVKAIGLKNNYVVGASIYSDDLEYLTVITDKNTGKRVKLSEFSKTARGRKGVQIIREIKTNPYFIKNTFVINYKETLGLKTKKGIETIKLTELPICDRYATGSTLKHGDILEAFEIPTIISKDYEKKVIEKENIDLETIDEKIMTIDDFLDNFEENK